MLHICVPITATEILKILVRALGMDTSFLSETSDTDLRSTHVYEGTDPLLHCTSTDTVLNALWWWKPV